MAGFVKYASIVLPGRVRIFPSRRVVLTAGLSFLEDWLDLVMKTFRAISAKLEVYGNLSKALAASQICKARVLKGVHYTGAPPLLLALYADRAEDAASNWT